MADISYSTTGFIDRDIDRALDGIAAAGFPQAELLGQRPHLSAPLTGRALSEFRARLQSRGLRARTLHAPLERNVLGAPDEEWRKQAMAVSASYLCFAGELGATDVIIHPVPNPCFVEQAQDPAMAHRIGQAVGRSLDELVPVAQKAG